MLAAVFLIHYKRFIIYEETNENKVINSSIAENIAAFWGIQSLQSKNGEIICK